MSANQKRKYIAMIVALCILLTFGVLLIARGGSGSRALPTIESLPPAETQTDAPDPAPSETGAPPTVSEDTGTSGDTASPASEPETEETTMSAVPAFVSTNGNMHYDKGHIYLRINHSKDIILHLTGGLAQSKIEWSVSDDSIADVDGGTIMGLTKGECTVTARYENDVLEIPVTVRELTVVDNCTYVDGILVANKSYGLPEDYDHGTLPITEEAFSMLCEDAAKEGLNIYESSSYRDYQFQVTVYNSMVSGYSKEYADAYSARPGHSEHQTGYTIDCNTIDTAFGSTPEGIWLRDHCHEYGFIIRYPLGKENITGYAYEPWHIRYVGVAFATDIYEQGLTLEEYLDIDSRYPDETPEEDALEEDASEEDTPEVSEDPEDEE